MGWQAEGHLLKDFPKILLKLLLPFRQISIPLRIVVKLDLWRERRRFDSVWFKVRFQSFMEVDEVAVAFVDNPMVDVWGFVIEYAFTIEIWRRFTSRAFLVKNDNLKFDVLSDFRILPLYELDVERELAGKKFIFFVAVLFERRRIMANWGVLLLLSFLCLLRNLEVVQVGVAHSVAAHVKSLSFIGLVGQLLHDFCLLGAQLLV